MKLTDIIFWLLMISIATFYVLKGNDMHNEKVQIRMDNHTENKQEVKSKEL
jgi:hypothetical protein